MKKEIVIIATGGTIAGAAKSAENTTGYTAGTFKIDELLNAIPALHRYEPLRTVQICNIDSSDITKDIWLKLIEAIETECAKESVLGVVVTHGTDTMEETAYLLQLILKTKKPVVLTGAMRPATAISSDGAFNLLEAIAVCHSQKTYGHGVVVVMNGQIHNARFVNKIHTTNLKAFGNLEYGQMGFVQDLQTHIIQFPNTNLSFPFTTEDLKKAPRIPIINLYADIDYEDISSFFNGKFSGIVINGLGHGMIPNRILQKLEQKNNLPLMVLSSRVCAGATLKEDNRFISVGTLTATKARILLMLSLAHTNNINEIKNYFAKY